MIRLALRVPAVQAELVLAELLELAPGGVEELELPAHDGRPAIVEFAVYGSPGELPDLPAGLQAAVGGVEVEVSTSEVPDDWSERWKQFHRPVLVEPPGAASPGADTGAGGSSSFSSMSVFVPSLLIRPPWEKKDTATDAEEIVIDPGQAFGTGAHATTHLCLELLLALAAADPRRGAVIDVGSGSGVLAIAAARLGYGPVAGLDNERESVAAIRSNAAANHVDVDARRFDLRREPLPDLAGSPPPADTLDAAEAPVLLANLLRPLLLDLADSIARTPATPRPRHLIASGLLLHEADEVATAFAERLSLYERERRQRGEWAALWLSPG